MEEDAALCDVVKKALEGKGVLAQIRASLRAAVFTAVDEHERSSGVHVPNPAALGVKHDAGGRLALQLVVDFLEHWELHQTLSILKLETDVPEEDLLSREELESTVMSGTGVAGGEGETKTREGKPAPVILRLLAGGRSLSQGAEIRVSPRDANGETPSGLGSGVGSSCAPGPASLSASYRNGGGEYPSEMSGPHGDHGGSSEEKDEGAREEEGAGRGSKESEQEIAGPDAGDVSSRVTMRKRRGGDGGGHSIVGDGASGGEGSGSNGASNGGGVEATDEPSPGTPSDSAPEEAPPATAAEREDQAGSAGGRFPLAMPPPADHQQQQQDSDSEIRSEASEGSPASCPAGDERRGLEDDRRRPGLEGGAEGRGWGRHYAGSMDESDYHFSEDAVSASADSPVRPGTGKAPGLFEGASDGGGGDDGSAVATTAAAEAKDTGGGLAGDLSGAREEQGDGGHEFECRSGEVGANGRLSGDGDGQSNAGSMGFESSSIDVDGGAGGGGGSALRESEGGGGGDEKEAQGGRSSNGSVGEEVGGARSDGGRSSDWGDESDDYYEDDDFHGDDDDDDDDHGDDDGGNGDVDARGVALEGSTVAVTSTGGGQGEEEIEEAVVEEELEERGGTLLVPGGDEGGRAEEDVLFDVDAEGSEREDRDPEEERGGNEEDLEWEARIGLSADSSVVVGGEEGEEDDLDMQSYEIEDVQSV